jgi:Tfp pilus assembly protein PilX
MDRPLHTLLEERAMILMTVLLLLSLLMVIGMGAALSVQSDLRMSANLRAGTAASYLADAGIESAKQQIALATTMPPIPTPSTMTETLGSGSYSVSFLSSAQSLPLSATVSVQSVGKTTNATQAINARVTKIYDLGDAALVLRGNARSINFAGASFSLSGLDHDLVTGAPLSGSPVRAGITVDAMGIMNQVEDALDTVQRRNVVGDDGNGAAIGISRHLPGNVIGRMANDLCAAPNAILSAVPSSGSLSFTREEWGSRTAPELHCITGLPGSGDTVVFSANTAGAGILVVRDAELVFAAEFLWEGWIVVTGSDVGLRVAGPENKEILGSLLIDENGNATGSGPAMLDVQGPLRVRLSRQAFNLAAPLVPSLTLTASFSALPFALKQDYWRSISP